MTLSGFSNAFIGTMLSWLKGLANWVLRLFNLAGRSGTSPLLWLSENWVKLLVLFLVLGVAADIIVWLVRWRPYWVWFRKERVIVNDEKFFAGGRIDQQAFTEDDELIEDDWRERDFVVTSSVARKPERRRSEDEAAPAKHASSRREKKRKRRTTIGTIVKRARGGGSRREDGVVARRGSEAPVDEAEFSLFEVDGGAPGVTDSYEDEVFNVSSLPDPVEYGGEPAGPFGLPAFPEEPEEPADGPEAAPEDGERLTWTGETPAFSFEDDEEEEESEEAGDADEEDGDAEEESGYDYGFDDEEEEEDDPELQALREEFPDEVDDLFSVDDDM